MEKKFEQIYKEDGLKLILNSNSLKLLDFAIGIIAGFAILYYVYTDGKLLEIEKNIHAIKIILGSCLLLSILLYVFLRPKHIFDLEKRQVIKIGHLFSSTLASFSDVKGIYVSTCEVYAGRQGMKSGNKIVIAYYDSNRELKQDKLCEFVESNDKESLFTFDNLTHLVKHISRRTNIPFVETYSGVEIDSLAEAEQVASMDEEEYKNYVSEKSKESKHGCLPILLVIYCVLSFAQRFFKDTPTISNNNVAVKSESQTIEYDNPWKLASLSIRNYSTNKEDYASTFGLITQEAIFPPTSRKFDTFVYESDWTNQKDRFLHFNKTTLCNPDLINYVAFIRNKNYLKNSLDLTLNAYVNLERIYNQVPELQTKCLECRDKFLSVMNDAILQLVWFLEDRGTKPIKMQEYIENNKIGLTKSFDYQTGSDLINFLQNSFETKELPIPYREVLVFSPKVLMNGDLTELTKTENAFLGILSKIPFTKFKTVNFRFELPDVFRRNSSMKSCFNETFYLLNDGIVISLSCYPSNKPETGVHENRIDKPVSVKELMYSFDYLNIRRKYGEPVIPALKDNKAEYLDEWLIYNFDMATATAKLVKRDLYEECKAYRFKVNDNIVYFGFSTFGFSLEESKARMKRNRALFEKIFLSTIIEDNTKKTSNNDQIKK